MKKVKRKDEFWLVLGTLNVLAIVYPTPSVPTFVRPF